MKEPEPPEKNLSPNAAKHHAKLADSHIELAKPGDLG
jgi:hypothetical protein